MGDRVVVQPGDDGLGRIGNGAPEGGLTPLLLVTEADRGRLHPVPDGLPLEVAALAEPLAVGMRAADQAEVGPGEGVAVFGCGPIGLAAIATLVDRGHHKVVAVDLSPTRLELALGLGAQAALDPATTDVWDELARLHGTTPFAFGPTPATAAFIEASGSDRVITDVLDHGPVGGRLSVVALHYRPIPTNYLLVLMKQFTIRGSMEYPEPVRGRHRPAGPPRPVRPHHPPLPARAVRRRPRSAGGLEGVRQGAGPDGPDGHVSRA